MKKKVRDGALKVITICLLAIIIVCACKIGTTIWRYHTARQGFDKVAQTANIDSEQFTGVIDFNALQAENPDICGWIYQKNTMINYPIVQGTDNEQYLHRDIYGKSSVSGSIFMDFRNRNDFNDFHTIIYGHHMNDGSMFKSLRGYTKKENYYTDHKKFELITPEKKYHLQVFSAYITPATSSAYTYQFRDDTEKMEFINNALKQSQIKTDDVHVSLDDKVITLSTCAYDYEQARYVVVCKVVPWTNTEIRKGEEIQKKINASQK